VSQRSGELHCVVCVGRLRRSGGGTSRAVPQLCEAVARQGVSTKLVTAVYPRDDLLLPAAPVEFIGIAKPRFGHQVRDAVEAAAGQPRERRVVIHDNGIWRPFHYDVVRAAHRKQVPLVVSPHGMLSPWALHHKRLKKQLAWWLYQQRNLAAVTAFHATSELEADEIRRLGFSQPIAVIPNGIDMPAEFTPSHHVSPRRTMLFLSRIHPKKGLLNLLHAFYRAKPAEEWRLVIAGPDEGGHQRVVAQEAAALGLSNRVEFAGEIADQHKWAHYAAADVFVLPSFSENFGLVVAEALASGTPVITTTPTPWRTLSERGFGWWVEPNIDALTLAIHEAVRLPRTRLREMGALAAPWARREFSWDTVAKEMKALYGWLSDGGDTPSSVQRVPAGWPLHRRLTL
jgi:glycosyltransferase involved in cell wall biosynthesis